MLEPQIQIEKIEELLNNLETLSNGGIHRETPIVFSKLIDALKGLVLLVALSNTKFCEVPSTVSYMLIEACSNQFLFNQMALK